MSKYRLHLINDSDKDFLKKYPLETDVRDGAYFCLVNKKGIPYYTIDKNIPIYKTHTFLEQDNIKACKLAQIIEGYTIFSAYCKLNNIKFSEQTPLQLFTKDLTEETIDCDNLKHLSTYSLSQQFLPQLTDQVLTQMKNTARSFTQCLRLIEATSTVVVDNIMLDYTLEDDLEEDYDLEER